MKWWVLTVLLLAALPAWAQKYPERRVVRAGNRAYERGEWQAAADKYQRALELQPESREAAGNLGSALFRQEKWSDAASAFEGVENFYGQGTALAHERKLQEALDALKNAMRANPNDQDAKFNYAYVKKLLDEQNKDQNKDQQDKQDQQNGQDKQDEQNQQGQDKQDQQDGGQNQQNQQDGQGGEQDQQNRQEQQNQNQQGQGGMSREDAERMLQAMQAQEDQTQDKKADREKAVVVGRSGKNW